MSAVLPRSETPQEAARRLASRFLQDGFKPEALHEYQTADGNPIFWRIRLKHLDGQKWIRPLSHDGIEYCLKAPEFPDGTPLYRLSDVYERPDEPVVLVEGEWCADKLTALGILATTTGGAGSASKADWEPLRGRTVIIWPDDDEPGLKYANEAIERLQTVGATISLIDIRQLELPAKGDAVDWLEGNPGATAANVLALPTVDPIASITSVRGMDVWEDPEPVRNELLPVEPLPPGIIPEPLRPFVVDVSHRMQCPPDFVAAALVVELSSIVGAGCGIKPKQRDDWMVVANLWGGVVGRPSMLKTPALSEALKPLSRLEAEAKTAYDAEMAEYQANFEVYKAQKEALKGDMLKAAKGKGEMEAARHAYSRLEEPEKPIWRRYKTNDATIEKISELLADNPRGLLLSRDELVGLLASWDKDGRESDRAFYLEAWNGYGNITTDRIGRGTVYTENLCVSVFGGIQPTKLLGYLYQATKGLGNDGLVQRLQLLVYPDEPKNWRLIDQYPDRAAKDRAFRVIETLAGMDFVACGAGLEDGDRIPCLRFNEQAQQLFYEWLTDLQGKLKDEEDPIMVEHLAKFRSLMPSLALVFHLTEIADGTASGPVSLSAAERAAAWCEYLEGHARRIYALVTAPYQAAAVQLSKKLVQGRLEDGFTVRDVYRQCWHLLDDREVVAGACQELVDLGWLREEVTPQKIGQRGKTGYLINPKVRSLS